MRVVAELLNRGGETSLDFLRSEFSVDVVILFRGVLGSREKHGTPHREVNRHDERGHADDGVAEVLQTFVRLDGVLGEECRGGDGRAGVTTSTDETGDDAEGTTCLLYTSPSPRD